MLVNARHESEQSPWLTVPSKSFPFPQIHEGLDSSFLSGGAASPLFKVHPKVRDQSKKPHRLGNTDDQSTPDPVCRGRRAPRASHGRSINPSAVLVWIYRL